MSIVTNVILAFSIAEQEEEVLSKVNAFFHPRALTFSPPSYWCADIGTKALEHPTFVAALNYFDLEAFRNHIRHIAWEEPENVQLMYCRQEEDAYTVVFPLRD